MDVDEYESCGWEGGSGTEGFSETDALILSPSLDSETQERPLLRKLGMRTLPIPGPFLLYLFAQLDRSNPGNAQL
ncbi:hypothetical protein M405DRAFT_806415 [Rhizopogon salebrosus TDB-379]|nr:hypothetical protein M405DRAFT_806415 [Rhizopogon salebrosus TDB-379]